MNCLQFKIQWKDSHQLNSGWSYEGDKMDLRTLNLFKKKLLTCDQSTGILYQIYVSRVVKEFMLKPYVMLLENVRQGDNLNGETISNI